MLGEKMQTFLQSRCCVVAFISDLLQAYAEPPSFNRGKEQASESFGRSTSLLNLSESLPEN